MAAKREPGTPLTSDAMQGWIDGRETHRQRRGLGGVTCDRQHRAAWPGQVLRSSYAHLLTLPDHLPAGAHRAARAIHDRLLELEEKGGWTPGEWQRLRQMEKAWGRRAAGKDVKFNLQGWRRKGDGLHTPQTVIQWGEIRRRLEDGRSGITDQQQQQQQEW